LARINGTDRKTVRRCVAAAEAQHLAHLDHRDLLVGHPVASRSLDPGGQVTLGDPPGTGDTPGGPTTGNQVVP
jgi:hypothetical protein